MTEWRQDVRCGMIAVVSMTTVLTILIYISILPHKYGVKTALYMYLPYVGFNSSQEHPSNNNFLSTDTLSALKDKVRARLDLVQASSTGKNRTKDTSGNLGLFNITVTEVERRMFKDLVKVFTETVPSTVTYMMYTGTLLGSFRHHGMIPWDDDLDLLVRTSDRDVLQKSLQKLDRDYVLNTVYSTTWKFYHRNATSKVKPWKWPFLDLFFYTEDATYIWDVNPSWGKLIYEKKDVFPLTRRPFMGLMLPAPCNTEKVLLKDFKNLDVCKSNLYDHKLERFKSPDKVVSLSCDVLKTMFPFVTRVQDGESLKEVLVNATSKSELKVLNIFTPANTCG